LLENFSDASRAEEELEQWEAEQRAANGTPASVSQCERAANLCGRAASQCKRAASLCERLANLCGRAAGQCEPV